ncbi:MAG: CdaR family protein [Chloroflexi bacterium]|nr:CdaR family protein [Chloroflexota bacterium]
MMQRLRESDLAGNALWLVISVVLATGVWYIAVTSADPIDTRRFSGIPIQFVSGDSTVMTNNPSRFVTVEIQGSQSAVTSRRSEDIVVRADLSNLGAGTHTVPLEVKVAWPESISIRRQEETQPSQITVELEPIETISRLLNIVVVEPPPLGFRNDDPETEILEMSVIGAASVVSEIVEIRGDLDLSPHRSPIELDVRPYAVNAEGDRVSDIELEAQTVTIAVNITRRDDVRQIAVRPNVRVETLPAGYTLASVSPDPRSLFVGGPLAQLTNIADTLFTVPISLEDRQADFELSVPVQLPSDDLFVMDGENSITVTIEILPIVTTRQIDNIAVNVIGLDENYDVVIVPQNVSAYVNGPVSLVNVLTSDDIQVVVDLNSLEPGVYDLLPVVGISQSELTEANVSLLPAELNVEIISVAAAESSETVIATATAPSGA